MPRLDLDQIVHRLPRQRLTRIERPPPSWEDVCFDHCGSMAPKAGYFDPQDDPGSDTTFRHPPITSEIQEELLPGRY